MPHASASGQPYEPALYLLWPPCSLTPSVAPYGTSHLKNQPTGQPPALGPCRVCPRPDHGTGLGQRHHCLCSASLLVPKGFLAEHCWAPIVLQTHPIPAWPSLLMGRLNCTYEVWTPCSAQVELSGVQQWGRGNLLMNRKAGGCKVCKYPVWVSSVIRGLPLCWAGQGLALCFSARKMPNEQLLASPLSPVPGIASFWAPEMMFCPDAWNPLPEGSEKQEKQSLLSGALASREGELLSPGNLTREHKTEEELSL